MRIDVNGAARDLADGTTLQALILDFAGSARGSAAVVDGEVVPRGSWAAYRITDGQHIELISAVQGG